MLHAFAHRPEMSANLRVSNELERLALRSPVASEPGSPLTFGFTSLLGFGLIVVERILDPGETVADHLFAFDQCVLDVPPVITKLGFPSLVPDHLECEERRPAQIQPTTWLRRHHRYRNLSSQRHG
jgi:hypothetical protein